MPRRPQATKTISYIVEASTSPYAALHVSNLGSAFGDSAIVSVAGVAFVHGRGTMALSHTANLQPAGGPIDLAMQHAPHIPWPCRVDTSMVTVSVSVCHVTHLSPDLIPNICDMTRIRLRNAGLSPLRTRRWPWLQPTGWRHATSHPWSR